MPIIQIGLVPVAIDYSINTLNVMSSNVDITIQSSKKTLKKRKSQINEFLKKSD